MRSRFAHHAEHVLLQPVRRGLAVPAMFAVVVKYSINVRPWLTMTVAVVRSEAVRTFKSSANLSG